MKRLLAIDDSSATLSLIKDILSGHDYQVETARGGREGIVKFGTFKPDIVTLDLSMPDMDGYEILTALKRIDKYANVLMVTATDHSSALKDCLEKGAVGFISKPFRPLELLNAIARVTETDNYVNRNIVTMFSLVTGKFQNLMTSTFPSSSAVVRLEDVKVHRNERAKGSEYEAQDNSGLYDSIKPSGEHASFLTEMEGEQIGLIISLLSESDLTTLFGNRDPDTASDWNMTMEFFNTLNSKVVSQLADATQLKLRAKRTMFLSRAGSRETFWQSTINLWNQLVRAFFSVTYNNRTVRVNILLCYDAGRIFT